MLRVRLLGPLTVDLDGRELELPASRPARSILALLACDPGREHARSDIAARFWPDVLDESARASLRTALSSLRKSLGEDGARHLLATRDAVALDVGWTDLAEFERLADAGRHDETLALCRGPLLEGLDDDWVLERRDEQRERVGAVLAALAAEAEGAGDLAAAVAHTRRQAALEPLAEEPVRALMRRLAAAGDRAGALTTYGRLQDRPPRRARSPRPCGRTPTRRRRPAPSRARSRSCSPTSRSAPASATTRPSACAARTSPSSATFSSASWAASSRTSGTA